MTRRLPLTMPIDVVLVAGTMREAYDVGLEDGAEGVVDGYIKEPDYDMDLALAYLAGWRKGAGGLSNDELRGLTELGH